MEYNSLEYQLRENPLAVSVIATKIYENEGCNPKVLHAVVELISNDYFQNESEDNILEIFNYLIGSQGEDIDWNDVDEVSELINNLEMKKWD